MARTLLHSRRWLGAAAVLALVCAGCDGSDRAVPDPTTDAPVEAPAEVDPAADPQEG